MQVTFVTANTQSFYLKQPVVAASINGDSLSPPVPVNGAKSDRLLGLEETV